MLIILFIYSFQKILESPNQFVPQNHAMIFIPLTIPPSFPMELPSVMFPLAPGMISATKSLLNADVPEFQPRKHVPREIVSPAVTGKYIGFSETDENNMRKKSSILNESGINDIEKDFVINSKNRSGTDNSDKKSKEKLTDTEKRSSQIYPKVDLEFMYRKSGKSSTNNTVTSNNNEKRNRFCNSSNSKIISMENSHSNSNNIDIMEKNSGNFTSKSSTNPKENSVKTEFGTAKDEKRPNGRRTYAQMLTLTDTKSNLCVPIQADLRNHSSQKQTGSSVNFSKVEQSSNCKQNTINTSNFVGIDVPEWHTVRSKSRKKIVLAKENGFEHNVFDAEADITTEMNETAKELQSTEVISHSCPPYLTESRAYTNVLKNSKPSLKSKKKIASKKIQIRANIGKFNIREPNFTGEIDATDFGMNKPDYEIEEVPIISPDKTVLYPAMLPSEVPLFVQTPITSALTLRRQAIEARLVGLKKCAYKGRQEFRIFQHENDSENILLKKEEEMVMRVLEQLSMNDKFEMRAEKTKDSFEKQNERRIIAHVENALLDKDVNDWVADRFSINAKPYQNLHTSNHFLGHFFGDNDDKFSVDMRSLSLLSVTHNGGNKFIEKPEISNTGRNVENFVPEYHNFGRGLINEEQNTGQSDQLNLGKNLNHFDKTNSGIDSIVRNESKISVQRSVREPVESIFSIIQNHVFTIFGHIETKFSQNMTYGKSVENKYCVVDTEMLEKHKKRQQTFPITAAVSHWLSRQRKENAFDPAPRIPIAYRQTLIAKLDYLLLFATSTDQDNTDDSNKKEENIQRPQNLIWPILTEHIEHKCIDSDDVDDIKYRQLNALPSLLTPTLPTYVSDRQSIYANKKKLTCNDIVILTNDKLVADTRSDRVKSIQNPATSESASNNIFANTPAVYCNIM